MSVALRTITRLQDADDINVSLGVGVDEYALVYDHDTARFVLRAPFAGILATGATVGATSQAQAFTNGIIGPSWKPAANSTTALQLQNAAGTSVLNVDTTNGRVGIGTANPSYPLHVAGTQDSINAVAYIINSGTGRGLLIDNVAGTSNFGLYIVTAASTNLASGMVFGGQPSGAGFATFAFYSDGKYALGPGDATRDTVLSRHGVSKFKISSNGVNGAAALYVVGQIGINAENPATALDISAGALTMAEMTAPTGAANKATLYTKDNGSGKTALCCKLGDDVEIVLATQA